METLGNLITRAIEPTRKYNQKKKQKQFKPDFARFKMKVWFADGNNVSFYSYDWQQYTRKDGTRIKEHNEWTSFKKLVQMVTKWLESKKAVFAEMYIDVNGRTCTDLKNFKECANYVYVVARFDRNRLRNHPFLKFTDTGKLDFKILQNYAHLRDLEQTNEVSK
jgi:hypothetical protein